MRAFNHPVISTAAARENDGASREGVTLYIFIMLIILPFILCPLRERRPPSRIIQDVPVRLNPPPVLPRRARYARASLNAHSLWLAPREISPKRGKR